MVTLYSCENCGRRQDRLTVDGESLRCEHCGAGRAIYRPPLLVVTGAIGAGKSTICQRLAGTIDGAVLLDGDIFSHDVASVIPPNADYEAFWRFLIRVAHEVGQNHLAVVYFSVMRPAQVLVHTDLHQLFSGVHFLGLHCTEATLRTRIARRHGVGEARGSFSTVMAINDELVTTTVPNMTIINADRPVAPVEADVRRWIVGLLDRSTDRIEPRGTDN